MYITIEEAEEKFGVGSSLIEDWEEVRKYEDGLVWTYLDGDDGTSICSGYHAVNRMGYYVGTIPVPDGEHYEIPVSRDVECELCDSANAKTEEEVDTDCFSCLGSGYRTEWF